LFIATSIVTECAELHSSMTFDVTVPSPRPAGSVAKYSCEVGYRLVSGTSQRTCLASLDWDGTEPTCRKVACPLSYHQICYNCDIVEDDGCPFVRTYASLDECWTAAISNNFMFVEHEANICTIFSCPIPLITYTNGSVALFSSCHQGKHNCKTIL